MSEASQARTGSPTLVSQIKPLIRTMRLKQWTKNIFVWAALLFDVKLFRLEPFTRTLVAFVLFCLISSAVYIINDLMDIEKDRQHPQKARRPLPAGTLTPRVAIAAAVVLTLACLPACIRVDRGLAFVLYGYLVLMIAYSLWLKHIVIVDVLVIAFGFVLRVAAGVVVVDAENFSPWIYMCMMLLALFLGLGKRRQEIVLMKDLRTSTRSILNQYNLPFLDEMLNMVTAATLMTYSLYTFSAKNVPPNHTMMLTIPFVIYGLFRYLYLIHVKGETDPPDIVVLKDRPLQLDVALFGLCVFLVFLRLPVSASQRAAVHTMSKPLSDDRGFLFQAPLTGPGDPLDLTSRPNGRSSARTAACVQPPEPATNPTRETKPAFDVQPNSGLLGAVLFLEELLPHAGHAIGSHAVEHAHRAIVQPHHEVIAQLLGPPRHLPEDPSHRSSSPLPDPPG